MCASVVGQASARRPRHAFFSGGYGGIEEAKRDASHTWRNWSSIFDGDRANHRQQKIDVGKPLALLGEASRLTYHGRPKHAPRPYAKNHSFAR
jgi:hypothetical protein